jgi:hypothetical protein
MKPVLLLNISDFNNEWNKSVLDKVWKERESRFRGPEPLKQPPEPSSNELHPSKSKPPVNQ